MELSCRQLMESSRGTVVAIVAAVEHIGVSHDYTSDVYLDVKDAVQIEAVMVRKVSTDEEWSHLVSDKEGTPKLAKEVDPGNLLKVVPVYGNPSLT